MTPELASKLLLTTAVAAAFALGRWIYLSYIKTPVVDFTAAANEIGEDSPAVEALLALREKYAAAGDHGKALEYSTKALELCPKSSRITELNKIDQRNASAV